MKKFFFIGLVSLALFEILKVYFIMPMPGSQQLNSIDLAYFLHSYRWVLRIVFGLMILVGIRQAYRERLWWSIITSVLCLTVVYYFNFEMTAESIFQQPEKLTFQNIFDNKINTIQLVIGTEHNGEARAYPIQFLIYHHQVQDTVGGKPIIVTYCSVCRTGRIYEPLVNGDYDQFRLVGMDHFNAMFEDSRTKSWWYQATGESVAGKMKGSSLPEVYASQMSLDKWFELYPQSLVMQADEAFTESYDSLIKFERGKSKSKLTGTDSLSWKDKSWVVGIQLEEDAVAYDWNELKEKRIIHDRINNKPILLTLADDMKSFVAFELPNDTLSFFTITRDTLYTSNASFDLSGRGLNGTSQNLKPVKAYQEFWHSWRTFHPQTRKH